MSRNILNIYFTEIQLQKDIKLFNFNCNQFHDNTVNALFLHYLYLKKSPIIED